MLEVDLANLKNNFESIYIYIYIYISCILREYK